MVGQAESTPDDQPHSPPVGWALTQDKPPGHQTQNNSRIGRIQPTRSIPNLVWGATWSAALAVGVAVAGAAIAMHSFQVHKYIAAASGLGFVAFGVYLASLSVRILLRIRRLLRSREG